MMPVRQKFLEAILPYLKTKLIKTTKRLKKETVA